MTTPRSSLRENLELSLETRRIISLVLDAVNQVAWEQTPKLDMPTDWTPDPILRTVVSYCYGCGLFSSQEIEAAALHDPVVRYLCANYNPSWERIREFRRLNTNSIRQCLALVLESMANSYMSSSIGRFFPVVNFAKEAEQRLRRAIQADSNSLDV
jgi:hypothetical protein